MAVPLIKPSFILRIRRVCPLYILLVTCLAHTILKNILFVWNIIRKPIECHFVK